MRVKSINKHGGRRSGAGRPAGTCGPFKETVQLRILPDTYKLIKRQARRHGVSRGSIVDALAIVYQDLAKPAKYPLIESTDPGKVIPN